jgi:Tfp pilus assembly protein PilO
MKYLAPALAATLLLLASAGVVGWWFTLRDDALRTQAALERSIADLRGERAALEAEIANHAELETERRDALERVATRLARLDARIPATAEFTQMMRTVSNLADLHALRITRIYHVDTTELEPGLQRLTYDVSTTGTFEDTVRFIQDLHATPRLIAVTRFRLATGSNSNSTSTTPTITLQATLVTLARSAPTPPEPEEEAPTPDEPPVLGRAERPQGGPA